MFAVYDNNKPAKYPECKVDRSWYNNVFETYEEALKYARMWIGDAWGGSWNGEDGVVLEVGVPWNYSGYGDVIEIREMKCKDCSYCEIERELCFIDDDSEVINLYSSSCNNFKNR